MFLEAGIADAYGAGFEYAPEQRVREHNLGTYYVQHQKYRALHKRYTDDTQMALSIGEAMLEDDPWNKSSLAKRFVRGFKRDERTGYAGGFYKLLCDVQSGAELLERLGPADSDKSGAAMRAWPLGLLPDTNEILYRAHIQASITHNTTLGIAAAQASALMVHYFYRVGGDQDYLGRYLENFVPEVEWSKPYEGKVGAKGWMSVQAAVTAVTKSKTLTEVLTNSVAFTGDVDTVATIAMAAASHCPLIVRDIHPTLNFELENGTYGRDYLAKLDQQLLSKFPSGASIGK